jgi:hypothetical protein
MCFDIAEQFFAAFNAAIVTEKSPSKKLKAVNQGSYRGHFEQSGRIYSFFP